MEQKDGRIRTVVKIGNQTYTVVGKEPSDHVLEASGLVDDKIKELKNKNPYLTTTQLAVLAALNISNEYVALMHRIEEEKKEED
ncbi:cell division protein ZapA [Alkalicoccus daliensis]|uniref:Cell division protein ZapA n=1 Tax=Alkalicoccus daliensis TaxID=745820 RepID=A0A1H0CFX2_9BACI|nr:cell division protein ZapA [Alkalicoccus daliensis]SDN56723.1 cell division protein ZapA [Alkalicoccus daliensis]